VYLAEIIIATITAPRHLPIVGQLESHRSSAPESTVLAIAVFATSQFL